MTFEILETFRVNINVKTLHVCPLNSTTHLVCCGVAFETLLYIIYK